MESLGVIFTCQVLSSVLCAYFGVFFVEIMAHALVKSLFFDLALGASLVED